MAELTEGQLRPPALATHFERQRIAGRVKKVSGAAMVLRNMPALRNAWNHSLYNSSLISFRARFDCRHQRP